jgi:hypothetical protein
MESGIRLGERFLFKSQPKRIGRKGDALNVLRIIKMVQAVIVIKESSVQKSRFLP